ncbi:MAG: hypothetical protein ACJ74T_10965 [Pyrinomonadaceae bacterium]
MYWFLLKKALPFTLTFIFGAVLSGLAGLFGHSEKKAESWSFTRTYEYGGHCRMRHRNLVAESKPLNILNVPDAVWQGGGAKGFISVVSVNVTFGADGKVQKVGPSVGYIDDLDLKLPRRAVWDTIVKAAQQIQFTPETINSVPVSVEREVEINLVAD